MCAKRLEALLDGGRPSPRLFRSQRSFGVRCQLEGTHNGAKGMAQEGGGCERREDGVGEV